MKKIALICLSLFLLNSCEDDNGELKLSEQDKRIDFKKISFQDFSKKFNLEQLNNPSVQSKFKTNQYFKEFNELESFNENSNEFTIDNSVVSQASFGDKTTYSMQVLPKDPKPNTVTNIVFQEVQGNPTAIIDEFKKDPYTNGFKELNKYNQNFVLIESQPVYENYAESGFIVDLSLNNMVFSFNLHYLQDVEMAMAMPYRMLCGMQLVKST